MKTIKVTRHQICGDKKILIPAGLKVVPATNLPKTSNIKYLLKELPTNASEEVESHFRNYGFGLFSHEVG